MANPYDGEMYSPGGGGSSTAYTPGKGGVRGGGDGGTASVNAGDGAFPGAGGGASVQERPSGKGANGIAIIYYTEVAA